MQLCKKQKKYNDRQNKLSTKKNYPQGSEITSAMAKAGRTVCIITLQAPGKCDKHTQGYAHSKLDMHTVDVKLQPRLYIFVQLQRQNQCLE